MQTRLTYCTKNTEVEIKKFTSGEGALENFQNLNLGINDKIKKICLFEMLRRSYSVLVHVDLGAAVWGKGQFVCHHGLVKKGILLDLLIKVHACSRGESLPGKVLFTQFQVAVPEMVQRTLCQLIFLQ